jgi:L-histidine Nalpha-methyltransferase
MGRLTLESHLSEGVEPTLADDVLDGLTRPFKELAPKHFYDARGSELFDAICELPEYYPTRTELSILRDRASEIAGRAGATEMLELGAGAATKARILLATGAFSRYVPFDVSEAALADCAGALADELPWLDVHGIAGDFERHLDRIPRSDEPRLIAFLGGTIGNFTPGARRRFLREIAGLLAPGDALLLGTDLVKDVAVLEAAYDDAAGVTAEFNRNMLAVLNRELDADFDLANFEHVAFFDPVHEWIEMRLRARRACRVHVGDIGLTVDFARGEEMRTEISAKFRRSRLEADYAAAGLELDGWWTDEREWFALSLARAPDDR